LRSIVVLLKGDRKAATLCLHHAQGIFIGLTHSIHRNSEEQPENVPAVQSR
jgi:hypothetical protein